MAHRVVQVGVGGFGRQWLKALKEHGASLGAELVGLVDVSADALAKARAETGLPEGACHLSLDEALSELNPEVVICVTPPEHHAEVVVTALEAGAGVISEKPIASNMDEARRMVDVAHATGRPFAVSQNYRYAPMARAVRDALASGRWGEPGQLALEFFKGPKFEGSFRRRMPYPLVADMSIHHYDLMRMVLGRDPEWTFARAFNPPWSWYDGAASVQQVIGFTGGLMASYSASWCALGEETGWNGRWRADCSKGVVVWDESGVRAGASPAKLEPCPVDEAVPTGQAGVLAEFLAAMAEGREPETSGRDNLLSYAMVVNTIASSESGEVVEF
jgi:predicted dehydrogenase